MNAIFETMLLAAGLVFAGSYLICLCVLMHMELWDARLPPH
jgi:hypothetical protein